MRELHCIYTNARSICNKLTEFHAMVYSREPDVVGVTETWAGQHIGDAEICVDGYDIFRTDRSTGQRGGGTLLMVKQELRASEAVFGDNSFSDQTWCRIETAGCRDFFLGICYRSPTDTAQSDENGRQLVELIGSMKGKSFMLMGDFNYPDIDWEHFQCRSSDGQQFLDSVEDAFLTQHVTGPTRHEALLDLIFTSEPDMVEVVSDIGYLGASDHCVLEWSLVVGVSRMVGGDVRRPDYRRADFEAIRTHLRDTDWKRFLDGNAESMWNEFRALLRHLELKYIPVKSAMKRKKVIWMTNRAVKLVNKKHKLYQRYKDKTHPAYVRVLRQSKKEVRRSRRNFEKKLADNIKCDTKSFFSYVRNKSKSRPSVCKIIDDTGCQIDNPTELVEKFNEFFASVFTQEDPTDFSGVRAGVHREVGDGIQDIIVEAEMLRKLLVKVRQDKSSGVDGITPRVISELKNEIIEPLLIIMNESLRTGIVPRDWRDADISPIFKKGQRSSVGNYRPVSLTSQIGKLLEAVIRDVIVQHLERHRLVRESQHGFRRSGSCLSNVLQFLDRVTGVVDEGDPVDVIFLDFSKAFDTVQHSRLLDRVEEHGIAGNVLRWIRAWLAGRRQRVCIGGKMSGWRDVKSGVPQGSVLGPLLFIIFVNDIDVDIVSWLLKFADDLKIFARVRDEEDQKVVQKDLNMLEDWTGDSKMKFNVQKCKVMHLGARNRIFNYFLGGQQLMTVDEERDLGVVLSSSLKCSAQCSSVYRKAGQILGMMGRVICYRSRDVLLRLYKALVRPHLEYCVQAWAPYYDKDKRLLEKIQHRFTRMIPGLASLPYRQRLQELGLWTLEERRNRADLLEVFKIYRGLSMIRFEDMFEAARTGTRGHSAKIYKRRCRLDVRRFFFSERVIDRWNRLPQDAIDSSTVNRFKGQLERLRAVEMDFFMDLPVR